MNGSELLNLSVPYSKRREGSLSVILIAEDLYKYVIGLANNKSIGKFNRELTLIPAVKLLQEFILNCEVMNCYRLEDEEEKVKRFKLADECKILLVKFIRYMDILYRVYDLDDHKMEYITRLCGDINTKFKNLINKNKG